MHSVILPAYNLLTKIQTKNVVKFQFVYLRKETKTLVVFWNAQHRLSMMKVMLLIVINQSK